MWGFADLPTEICMAWGSLLGQLALQDTRLFIVSAAARMEMDNLVELGSCERQCL